MITLKNLFPKNLLLLALNLFFIVLMSYYLLMALQTNYIGVSGHFEGQNWVVDDVDQDGFGFQAGIVPGDLITAVDGRPLLVTRSLLIWHRFIPNYSVSVQHDLDPPRLIIMTERVRIAILLHNLPICAVALICLLLGNWVVYSKPGWPVAWKIFNFSYCCGFIIISLIAVSRDVQFGRDLEFVAIAIAGPFFASLLGDLPTTPKLHFPKLPMLLPGFLLVAFSFYWEASLWRYIDLNDLVKQIFAFYISFWIVISIILLVLRIRKIDRGLRYQIIILLIVLIIAFCPILSYLISHLIDKEITPVANLYTSALVLIPFAMWYVLAKNKVVDPSFFIRRTTPYLLFGLPMVSVFTWLLLQLYPTAIIPAVHNASVVTLVCLCIVYIFSTFKEKILNSIEKNLFKDYFTRKTVIKEFQSNILKIRDPEKLINTLVNIISVYFGIENLFLTLRENDVYVIKSHTGRCSDKKIQAHLLACIEDLPCNDISFPNLPVNCGLEYLIPLRGNDQVFGLLLLGAKKGGIRLTQEDILTIRALVDNFSLGLENAELLSSTQRQFDLMVKEMATISRSTTETKWLNRMLISAQEEERKKLALELHDGPTQLLVHVIRNGQKALDQGAETDTLRQKLGEQIEIAKDVIYELRELCFRLRPSLLDDLGLIPTLEWLANEIRRTCNLEVDLKYDDTLDLTSLHKEVELAVFRAVQEIINNTLKHAEATRLSISLGETQGKLYLSCYDNGRGFIPEDSLECLQANRLGLLGMKKRISWVGGTFKLNSSPGKGTMISINIPISSGKEDLVIWNPQ